MTSKHNRDLVTQVAIDLFSRTMQGHAGEIAYLNGGGELFKNFATGNPDYYLYNGESDHIEANKVELAKMIKDTEHLIVVGQGPAESFENKEMKIIKLLDNLKKVTFIDVSAQFNKAARGALRTYCKDNNKKIVSHSLTADFNDIAQTIQHDMKSTVISTGSLITNLHNTDFRDFPSRQMSEILGSFAKLAGPNGQAVLCYDSNRDAESLKKAYNHQLAPFITNIAKIIQQFSNGIKNFDGSADSFSYTAEWYPHSSQIAHNIVATKDQDFSIENNGIVHNFSIKAGDTFNCMTSIKAAPEMISTLGYEMGLESQKAILENNGIVAHVLKQRATCAMCPQQSA
jgi:hypothetical protein